MSEKRRRTLRTIGIVSEQGQSICSATGTGSEPIRRELKGQWEEAACPRRFPEEEMTFRQRICNTGTTSQGLSTLNPKQEKLIFQF